jgi:hypothetical protein
MDTFALALRRGFSGLRFTTEDIIAEGDLVACRFTMTGTNTGEFMGMPATGRAVSVPGVDILRFKTGKVVEHWGLTDELSLLQQLGLLPPQSSNIVPRPSAHRGLCSPHRRPEVIPPSPGVVGAPR